MTTTELTHESVEQHMTDECDWPRYFVTGENMDDPGFVPAYYRVSGPNGPVSYINPSSGPYPTTMVDMAMDAHAVDFRECDRSETPWAEHDPDR